MTIVPALAGRPLRFAHALLALGVLASSTLLAIEVALTGRRARRPSRLSWLGLVAPLTLLVEMALGLALYPGYRVEVRAPDLDLHAPALARLFDLKEHLAALALPLLAAAGWTARAERAGASGLRGPLVALSSTGAAFAWAAALIGFVVTVRHPLGGR